MQNEMALNHKAGMLIMASRHAAHHYQELHADKQVCDDVCHEICFLNMPH
jgi:hypothetical protein